MTQRFPTLVTYRSATDLRDAGIRYGLLKAGMHVGVLASVVAVCVAHYLFWKEPASGSSLQPTLLIFGVIAMGVAWYCGRKAEFPQIPRLTLDELETMQKDMGLPDAVFRQTQDSVLMGSPAEHKAIEQTDALLARVKQPAGQ